MALPVSSYMTEQPYTIGRRASLAKAHRLMHAYGIRHLPVLEGGKLVGIVSRGDLHLLETIAHVPLEAVDVDEAMTKHPYAVVGTTPVDVVVDTMAANKYGSAIVVDRDGVVEGIFTTIDAMKVLVNVLRPDRRRAQGVREVRDQDSRPTLRLARSPSPPDRPDRPTR